MQCDKYQEEGGSSGPPTSRARRFSPFSSGRVAPQRPPAAGDGSVPRQVWSAAPAIAVVEAKTAPARGPPGWRRFAVSTIAAAMVAASLIGMYFRAEVASYVTQYAGQQDTVGIGTVGAGESQNPSQDSQKANSVAPDSAVQQQAEANRASSQRGWWDTAPVKQAAEAMAPAALAQDVTALRDELRASAVQYGRELAQERDRGEALAKELARAQRDLETQVALSGKTDDEAAQVKAAESATAELRQSLQKERDRAEALARELARAQRDLETQVALLSKTDDEAAQVKQAAESANAELLQSLQKEHDRAEALAGEPARVQRDLKTQTALSRKIGDETVQIRQAAETEAADLRQSRQKEGDSAAALARGLESTRRPIDARIALERAATSQINQAKPASEAAAAEQPAAAEVKGTPEAAKSLARANALLGQGNIGAGRVVRHPQRRGVHQIPSHQWRSGKCNLRQARHRLERAPRSKGMSYACYSRSQMRATSPSISPPEPAPPMTAIFR